MNWDDQRVVLTGASSGIGRALALVLAERGARLALVARRAEVLAELGEAIEESGGRQPLVVPCDVGDLDQVGALYAEVEAQWGGADVLINNAGRGYYRSFADADVSELEAVVQTNLLGTIYCTRAFLPGMLAQGRGRLVFISSIVGEFPVPKHAVYSATKCAINGLAESLDYELGLPRALASTSWGRAWCIPSLPSGLVHSTCQYRKSSPSRPRKWPNPSPTPWPRASARAFQTRPRFC